ncbi:MAG TPA: PPC domain-containing protein [Gemmataceae bacterium]|nr:PPC domain-containing protein [Gemmataceae bacterium]
MTTRVLLCIFLAFPASLHAAPPKLDYFFPAGAQRGGTVTITAAGTFAPWPVKAHVEGNGIDVKPAKASGKLDITIAKDAEPGVRWIRLYNDEGASVARPFLVGLLPEITEQEPNDDPKKPQVITQPSVVVNGRLGKTDDVDTFAVKLTKGQTLVASLEAHHTLRSPMDGVMQILSADGFVLEQNDDYHGLDPQIAFVAPKDGVYLVRIFAFPAMPDATVRFAGKETFIYRLTLTTGPYVEYAYPLAIPDSAPTKVDLIGWNLPPDLQTTTVTPRPGASLLTLFDPRITGTFQVRQDPNPAIAKSATTREVVPPITITGKLEKRGDIDVYSFNARKGQKLAFRIESRTLGFPLDPVLIVTDSAGKVLVQNKAAKIGADPSLDFTATQDGAYRIEVRDLANSGSFRHAYRLRIAPPTPDFSLSVATDTFTLSAAKPLEIPVTITRNGGFKGDIALRVEGAPKEVAVTTSAKGVTLRTTANTLFARPIRIIGTAKDGATRTATVTLADFGRATDSLWLTITASR